MSACRLQGERAALTPSPIEPVPAIETLELRTTADDHRIARLAAAAIGLALVDAAIPLPLPGIKPGLANIVTLLVLYRYGFGTAAWVTGLRVFAGGLLLGHFLAPGFFLSLAGAGFSLFMLAAAQYLPRRWFGPVSLSVLAAFAHISGQLLLARFWLIPHDGVFLLAPVFLAAALFFGIINGLIVARLLGEADQEELQHA
jgi:heptaprenyl diphosphate synthase